MILQHRPVETAARSGHKNSFLQRQLPQDKADAKHRQPGDKTALLFSLPLLTSLKAELILKYPTQPKPKQLLHLRASLKVPIGIIPLHSLQHQ